MARDDEDQSPKSFLPALLANAGKAVQQRAVGAITTLVGAYMPDVMARAQSAKDEREARSVFKRALSEAAARRAAEDEGLVDRMLDRMVDDEFGKQARREAIAQKAIEHLQEEVPLGADETEKPIEDDWLNIYNGHAEKASSEALQDMWARVLAGEIRRPGTVSLRTLQFVSVLDRETADAASRVLPWLMTERWLLDIKGDAGHLDIHDRILLRDVGLIGALHADLTTTLTTPDQGYSFITFGPTAIVYHAEIGTQVAIRTISTSLVCRELASIIPFERSGEEVEAVVAFLKSTGVVKRINVGPYFVQGETWIQPGSSLRSTWVQGQD